MSDVDRGFTLVEILVVVILLGALAMIVVPHITDASDETREAVVKSDLRGIRTQIQLYRSEHRSTYPSMELFVEQMTGKTQVDGSVGGDLGPYLMAIPTNPYNNDSTVTCENSDTQLGDGTSAWHYNTTTGYFRASDTPEHAGW